jgi:hypothetical protein
MFLTLAVILLILAVLGGVAVHPLLFAIALLAVLAGSAMWRSRATFATYSAPSTRPSYSRRRSSTLLGLAVSIR